MAFADGNIVIGTSVDVGGMNTGLYKIQKAMKRWTRVIGVGLTAGLYKVGKASLDAASDLQEIQNVVDVAFKDMSYKIEEFTKICIEHFGMSQLSAKQTAGSFMAMGASIGLTKEAASDMAVELTGLTGDFASFYNISQQYAKVALSAVYTGETETLKRYGIILTEANLQEYALTQGITKKVKAMNAEEKTLLRYNYIMQATENMHGDFERTQESWANTLRVLKERWTQLLSVVGAGTIQVIQPFIRMISEATSKLIGLFQYINDLLGIEASLDTAEVSQDMEELSDSVEEAGETIKHQLGSFDKLNNLITNTNKANDDTSDLDKLYEKFQLSGYVIDSMKNWEVSVAEFSLAVKTSIGEMIEYLIEKKEKFDKVIEDFREGKWFDFGFDSGKFIREVEEDVALALGDVDWDNIGAKIGDFFKGIIWSDALAGWIDILATAFDGVITAAAALVDSITIADLVKLSNNVSGMATKLFNTLSAALKKVNWKKLGKKVSTFLKNLDWKTILKSAAEALWEGLKGALELAAGIFDGAPVASAFVLAVVTAIQTAKWIGLDAAIKKSATKAIANWKEAQGISVLAKTIGVVSLGLSVAIAVADITDVAEGETVWNSSESLFKSLASSVCAAIGIGLITANPVAGVITGLVTLAVNIGLKYKLKPSDDEQQKKYEADLREELDGIQWYRDFKDTIEAVVNLKVQAEARITEVDASMSYYEKIAGKWFELSQNQDDLSEAEKALMKLYSEELVSVMPELKTSIDEVSGAYKGTREQLDLLILSTREYLRAQAYGDAALDYQKQIAEAEMEQYEAEKKLTSLRATLKGSAGSIAGTMTTYIREMMKTNGYKNTATYAMDYKYVLQEINKAIESGSHTINYRGIDFDFGKLKYNWDEDMVDETITDLFSTINIWEGMLKTAEEKVDAAEKDVEYLLQKQADALANYTKSDAEYQKTIEDAGDNTTKGFAKGIKKNPNIVVDNSKSIADASTKALTETLLIESPSKVTEGIGEYVTEGFAIGILNGIDEVVSATRSVVSAALDIFNDTNILPTLKIVPEIDVASMRVPDIASGSILPVGVTAASSSASAVSGMSKKELSGIIGNAVAQAMSNIVLKSEFNVNGDPKHIFDIVQTEARVYNKRTGSPAFAGGR